MDRETYAQMVDYIEDWWGPSSAWGGAERLGDGFAIVDADAAYEVLMSRQSDPSLAQYPPRPSVLKAEALARMHRRTEPALPETTEGHGWDEFSRRSYGTEISLIEAVERRHAEIHPNGCQDAECHLHKANAPP